MKAVNLFLCLSALIIAASAANAQMQTQTPILNEWKAYSVATGAGGSELSSGTHAVTHPMTADDFNGFYSWMCLFDVSKFTRYNENEFVCVNYSINCLKSAAKKGFNNIYACRIQNFRNKGGHFVVAANVKPGQVFWNNEGQKITFFGGWIIVDPQDDSVLNSELIAWGKKGVQENMTMFTPDGFYPVYWYGGGLRDDVYQQCVVADFTIDTIGNSVSLNRYFTNTTTLILVPKK